MPLSIRSLVLQIRVRVIRDHRFHPSSSCTSIHFLFSLCNPFRLHLPLHGRTIQCIESVMRHLMV
jgi:hypothetical protein